MHRFIPVPSIAGSNSRGNVHLFQEGRCRWASGHGFGERVSRDSLGLTHWQIRRDGRVSVFEEVGHFYSQRLLGLLAGLFCVTLVPG